MIKFNQLILGIALISSTQSMAFKKLDLGNIAELPLGYKLLISELEEVTSISFEVSSVLSKGVLYVPCGYRVDFLSDIRTYDYHLHWVLSYASNSDISITPLLDLETREAVSNNITYSHKIVENTMSYLLRLDPISAQIGMDFATPGFFDGATIKAYFCEVDVD